MVWGGVRHNMEPGRTRGGRFMARRSRGAGEPRERKPSQGITHKGRKESEQKRKTERIFNFNQAGAPAARAKAASVTY